jgi:hypothetical protein
LVPRSGGGSIPKLLLRLLLLSRTAPRSRSPLAGVWCDSVLRACVMVVVLGSEN